MLPLSKGVPGKNQGLGSKAKLNDLLFWSGSRIYWEASWLWSVLSMFNGTKSGAPEDTSSHRYVPRIF